MNVQEFLKLEGVRESAYRSGPERWQCLCPAHADRKTKSLCIGLGTDGRILLKCQAGCSTEAVCQALGLSLADLFPEPTTAPNRPRATPAARAPQTESAGPVVIRMADVPPQNPQQRHVAQVYPYFDEKSCLLYEVMRYEPKGFAVRRPNGQGGWISNLEGVRRVPYRLLGLGDASPEEWVFVCEGEKDCDNLAHLGLTASCNPLGAGKWSDEYNEHFRGRKVCILPDNDEAGRMHARNVLRALTPVAETVRVLALPDLPLKGDVSDWIERHGAMDHKTLREELLALVEQCLPAPPSAPPPAADESGPMLLCLGQIESKPVAWLWPDRIPQGMLTLLASDPGLGKTWTALDIIARVTKGLRWPDQPPDGLPAPAGSAILLTSEDTLPHTIKPRLERLGGDPDRVFTLKGTGGPHGRHRLLDVKEDLPVLETILGRVPDVRLIVFDPITAYLGETDSHKNAEVRAVLGGLSELAEQHNVAILAISHMNKNSDIQAIYRVMGSMGFTAAARAVWTIARDKQDRDRRLLIPLKMNLCAEPTGLAFRLHDDTLTWEATPVEMTADEALADMSEDERSAVAEAMAWLDSLLQEGRLLSTQVLEMAAREAIAEKTLRRAKTRLKVRSRKEGKGEDAQWYWEKTPVAA